MDAIHIKIEFDHEGEQFIVSSDWPLLSGNGATLPDALADYAATIREYVVLVWEGAHKGNDYDKTEAFRLARVGIVRDRAAS